MFSRVSRLTVKRPSPTTILFTVSNAPSQATLGSTILFFLEALIRCLIGFFVLIIDAAKGRNGVFFQDDILAWDRLWETKPGLMACSLADRLDWRLLTVGSIILIYLILMKGYTEESLLVIRGLGIETSSSSSSYLSTATTRFIPTTLIQDIVIHEAFKGFEVRFYLGVIVSGQTEVVVVFPDLLPRRLIVEEVWRGAKACLYESKT